MYLKHCPKFKHCISRKPPLLTQLHATKLPGKGGRKKITARISLSLLRVPPSLFHAAVPLGVLPHPGRPYLKRDFLLTWIMLLQNNRWRCSSIPRWTHPLLSSDAAVPQIVWRPKLSVRLDVERRALFCCYVMLCIKTELLDL